MLTPREQLADLLKQAREGAGYSSQRSFARHLDVSPPVISKAENALQNVPSDAVLIAYSGKTGVPLDKLTDLARRARSGTPDWFMSYRAAEAEATSLRFWGPLVVPGLLQTEAYARAYEQSDEVVAARLARQNVIGQVRITAAIGPGVLERCIGSPAVMAEQCGRLAELAEQRVIRLYAVPQGVNMGLGGAFAVASRGGALTVSLTTAVHDMTSTEMGVTDSAMNLFETILGAALSAETSLQWVRAQEDTWKAQI